MIPADLRLRLVVVALAVICVTQLRHLPVLLLLGAGLAILALYGSPGRTVLRRLVPVMGFALLLFLTLPFTVPGTELFSIGPLQASSEGLRKAALIAMKIAVSALLIVSLLGNVPPARLGAALGGLRVPPKFVQLLMLMVRYSSLITDELARLREAMRARSFTARSGWHGWRCYGNLFGMTLVRALDRAHRVHEAMLCRGYDGQFRHITPSAPLPADWLRAAALGGAAILILAVDRA